MKDNILQILNEQIQEEMFSAYLYLSMSAFCADLSLDGFANWFMVQYQEEMDHAMGFYNFILERGGQVKLLPIAQPEQKFEIKTIFEEALKHEQHITSKINDIYALARKEQDYPLESFIKWYIDEQVEEEDNANKLVDQMNLIGDNSHALLMLDRELAGRTHTPGGPNAQSE